MYYTPNTVVEERMGYMAWELDSDRPIYIQLVERMQMEIVSGGYAPGQKLPSVRELAMEAAVNPNTMQKAFAELERTGLIITQRTNGRMVTEDKTRIDAIRQKIAGQHMETFFAGMRELGYTKEQIIQLVEETYEA